MIVTCPSCTARYKINASKIKGRGAKITCPKCSHRFVVYRDGEGPKKAKKKRVPENVASWDFRTLGLTWRVRRDNNTAYDFFDLNTLRSFLDEGQVETDDVITYDNRDWSRLSDISDLDAFFYDVWEKAKRGEVSIAAPEDERDDEEEDDEDDADAPTTIVGRGSELASELRQAVAGLGTPEAVTRETIPNPEGRGQTPGANSSAPGILIEDSTPVPVISSPSFTAPAPMEAGGVAEVFSNKAKRPKPGTDIGSTLGPKPAPLTATPKPVQRESTPPPASKASEPAPAKKAKSNGSNLAGIAIGVVALLGAAAVAYFTLFVPTQTPAPAPHPTPAPAAVAAPQPVAPAPAPKAPPEGTQAVPDGTEAGSQATEAAPQVASSPSKAAPTAASAPTTEAAATKAPSAPETAPKNAPETPPSAPAEGGG